MTTPESPPKPPQADPPTPPELEIIEQLQDLLQLTAFTLLFLHPDIIQKGSEPHTLYLEAQVAQRLLHRAADLAEAATEYETVVLAALREPEPDPTDDDIPF